MQKISKIIFIIASFIIYSVSVNANDILQIEKQAVDQNNWRNWVTSKLPEALPFSLTNFQMTDIIFNNQENAGSQVLYKLETNGSNYFIKVGQSDTFDKARLQKQILNESGLISALDKEKIKVVFPINPVKILDELELYELNIYPLAQGKNFLTIMREFIDSDSLSLNSLLDINEAYYLFGKAIALTHKYHGSFSAQNEYYLDFHFDDRNPKNQIYEHKTNSIYLVDTVDGWNYPLTSSKKRTAKEDIEKIVSYFMGAFQLFLNKGKNYRTAIFFRVSMQALRKGYYSVYEINPPIERNHFNQVLLKRSSHYAELNKTAVYFE